MKILCTLIIISETKVEELFPERRYLYKIAGVNESGKGEFSAPVSVFTRDRDSVQGKIRQSRMKLSVINAFGK